MTPYPNLPPAPWKTSEQWPAIPDHVDAECDGTSVGVIVERDATFLVFDRKRPPLWTAMPAGHIDDHGSPEAAARDEVEEEVGLYPVTLRPMFGPFWFDNPCRRHPSDLGPGHSWTVYWADDLQGSEVAAEDEVAGMRWVTLGQLQGMVDATTLVARGHYAVPSLEPVWCLMLAWIGIVDLSPNDVEAVGRLLHLPPYEAR